MGYVAFLFIKPYAQAERAIFWSSGGRDDNSAKPPGQIHLFGSFSIITKINTYEVFETTDMFSLESSNYLGDHLCR
jgi:hypothetical protein